MFKKSSKKFSKLKVKFNSHCEDERSEDAAIQTKSTGSPRAKALAMTKKSLFSTLQPFNPQKAFTLAEVLITLVIIGVVAAITVPMLMNGTNDKEYNVARQKAQATIGEAFRQASVQGELTTSITSAKDFIDEVLAKRYLKIAKSCENATDCGFTAKIKRPDGQEVDIDKNMTDSTDAYAITALPDLTSSSANYGTYATTNPITSSVYITPAYFQTLDGFSVKLFWLRYLNKYIAEKIR